MGPGAGNQNPRVGSWSSDRYFSSDFWFLSIAVSLPPWSPLTPGTLRSGVTLSPHLEEGVDE